MNTTITLLPTQKSKVLQSTQIGLYQAINKIETNSTPEILRARNCAKGDKYYEFVKEKSPHFIFGSIPGKDKKICNIQKFTGLVYCDIDQGDIVQCGYNLNEISKAIFEHYHFVVFSNLSFGGKGLGFVLYCPDLIIYNAPNAYEQAYKAFAAILSKDFNVKLQLDAVCFNPNRQTALSFDPNILLREHPLPFSFEFNASLPYCGGKSIERELDLSMRKSEKLYTMFYERFRNYYTSATWVETETGRPVPYQEGLIFDPEKYHLTRFFDFSVLLEFDPQLRNVTETLVYFPNGIASTTLITGTNFKVLHGSRANFMKAFVLNYLFLLKVSGNAEKIGKFYVYNLLLALNDMMFDKTGNNHTPLPGSEINFITQDILEKFISEEFSPTLSKKSHIRTADCIPKLSSSYKEGTKPRTIIVNEINKIKHEIQNKILLQHILEYSQENPACSPEELTNHLLCTVKKANGTNYKVDTIKRIINRKVSFPESPSSIKIGGRTKEEWKSEDDTFNRITRCVDQLIVLGDQIKQKEVTALLSKYMSRSTVLRHWPKIKEKVKVHNLLLKKGIVESHTFTKRSNNSKRWDIYHSSLNTIFAFSVGVPLPSNSNGSKKMHIHIHRRGRVIAIYPKTSLS